jgi:hypothetical protein
MPLRDGQQGLYVRWHLPVKAGYSHGEDDFNNLPPGSFYSRISPKVHFRENGGRVAAISVVLPCHVLKASKNDFLQRNAVQFRASTSLVRMIGSPVWPRWPQDERPYGVHWHQVGPYTGVRPTTGSSTSHITIDHNVRSSHVYL